MNKKIEWVKVNIQYKGLWVALDEKETRVVSSAKDAKTVYNQALEKGVKVPILFRVPEEATNYIG